MNEFHPQLNVIVGKNAQGKTSILESLSLVTQLESFRSSDVSELIKYGEIQASCTVDLNAPTKSRVLIGLENKKKSIRIDETKISSKSKYSLLGTSVTFVPDDLYLIKGGPEARRKFFVQLAINLDPSSVQIYQQYEKNLKQRNRILKGMKEGDHLGDQLEIWTDQFIGAAVQVYEQRFKILERLREVLPSIYQKLFDVSESIEILHDHGFDENLPDRDSIARRMSRLRGAETAIGYSLVGPHRDDFKFNLNSLNARQFASQGQTRSLVIALKISQLELTREDAYSSPLLLLDDIVSELDETRTLALVSYLADYDGQLFVTTAESSKLKTLHSQFASFKLIDLTEDSKIVRRLDVRELSV